MSRYRKLTTICAAVVLSLGLAACGGGGGGTSGGPPAGPDPALGAAQTAAATAATEAGKAATAAETAADGQTMNKDADPANYALAQDSATRARAAANAAQAASDAAAATKVTADAQAQQAIAVAKQGEAEAEKTKAETAAGMVQVAQDALDRADAEAKALAAAKGAAKTAADAAETAAADAEKKAMDAEAAATTVEELAPGSAAATSARNAATAARTAATAARNAATAAATANTAAQAADNSADAKTQQGIAEGHQATAESEQGKANSGYDTAMAVRDRVQDTDTQTKIATARSSAKNDAADADMAYKAAKQSAEDARAKATAARAAANKAKAARTNYAEADTQATLAEAAATAAETAAADAMTARDNAATAYADAQAATTVAAAEAAAGTAKSQRMAAQTAAGTANTQYMAANTAATKAAEAAPGHVLGLLMAANDSDETNTKDRAARIKVVAGEIASAANSTGNRNDSRNAGEASVSVSWPADTPDDPDTTGTNEFVAGLLSVTISGMSGDGNVTSETRASKDNSDPANGTFTDNGDILNNAEKIAGPSGFAHGFDITDVDSVNGDRHMIVFTDKKQATALVSAKTITIANLAVVSTRIVRRDKDTPIDVEDLANTAAYDHDGNSSTLPLVGTWSTCTTAAGCLTTIDGKVTGSAKNNDRVFNAAPNSDDNNDGSPDNGQGITKAATAASPMNDFLAFGVWMDEDVDGAGSETAPGFGAFASVGTSFATPATLVGKATYNGAATGVYTEGTKVDYFQGSATLKADFGAIDTSAERATDPAADTTLGTVTGTIDNIVAGGKSMSDIISLNAGAIQSDGNIQNGNARMGTATVKDATATYPYNGTWSGQFGGEAAATGATGVDLLPPAVAGTFGVTGKDDMGTTDTKDDVTRSYVGAFGARR